MYRLQVHHLKQNVRHVLQRLRCPSLSTELIELVLRQPLALLEALLDVLRQLLQSLEVRHRVQRSFLNRWAGAHQALVFDLKCVQRYRVFAFGERALHGRHLRCIHIKGDAQERQRFCILQRLNRAYGQQVLRVDVSNGVRRLRLGLQQGLLSLGGVEAVKAHNLP